MTDTSTNAPADGIGALMGRRERRTRSNMVPPSTRRPLQITPDAPAPPVDVGPGEEVSETAPESQVVAQPARPRRANPPRPKVTAGPAANGMRATTVNMPQDIFARFDAARKARAIRTVDVLLDAIAAHADDLANLILARRPALETGGLFPGRVVEEVRPGSERHTAGDNITVNVKLPSAHLNAIDGLVADADIVRMATRPTELAVTRSELIVAALDAHLPEVSRRRRS